MRVFESDSIRNICLVGHGASGKTSLTSAMLFDAGAVNRLARVEDGNTVTDWEEEEIERKISISCALAHCEWNKKKVNILDTPGYRPFLAETQLAMRAADAAVVVVDAVAGVEVQTEKVWEFCDEYSLPRIIVINKLDRDNASSERSLSSLEETFGRGAVAVEIPMGLERDFDGVISIVTNKAYRYARDGSGKFQEEEVPAEFKDEAAEKREKLIEMVAESSDTLMEKFFAEGTLDQADLMEGLKNAVLQRSVYPVFYASATLSISESPRSWMPSRICSLRRQRSAKSSGIDPKTNQPVERAISSKEPYAAYVFKTIADPFAGRISLIKLYSGVMRSDSTYNNQTKGKSEKLGPLQIPQGKTMIPVGEVHAGDFFAVTKLRETTTGDTLCDPAHAIVFASVEVPEPSITFAIEPKSRGDEDKISNALARIARGRCGDQIHPRSPNETAAAFRFRPACTWKSRWPNCGSAMALKLFSKRPRSPIAKPFGAKRTCRAATRSRPAATASLETAGSKWNRCLAAASFEFVDEIFGGSIPRNFIPAVEKGNCRCGCARISRRIPCGRLQGDPLRRQLSPGRFFRNGLQDRRQPCIQKGDGGSQSRSSGAYHERRDLCSAGIRRSPHGRSQQQARQAAGDGHQAGHPDHQGAGSHVGNGFLCSGSHFGDRRSRNLSHGIFALRRGPGAYQPRRSSRKPTRIKSKRKNSP